MFNCFRLPDLHNRAQPAWLAAKHEKEQAFGTRVYAPTHAHLTYRRYIPQRKGNQAEAGKEKQARTAVNRPQAPGIPELRPRAELQTRHLDRRFLFPVGCVSRDYLKGLPCVCESGTTTASPAAPDPRTYELIPIKRSPRESRLRFPPRSPDYRFKTSLSSFPSGSALPVPSLF